MDSCTGFQFNAVRQFWAVYVGSIKLSFDVIESFEYFTRIRFSFQFDKFLSVEHLIILKMFCIKDNI